jgi:phospholipid/cholesterol/gamma-HCH transport system substrate-binding protein
MKKLDAEVVTGCLLFVVVGMLVYVSLQLGYFDLTGSWGYPVYANFTTAGGLQKGAVIELAGVQIGRVEAVDLVDYQARVMLKIHQDVPLSEDARVAIKTKGLIGERYVEIAPGRSTTQIKPGGQLRETESPVDITELIAKFIFGNVEKDVEEQSSEH